MAKKLTKNKAKEILHDKSVHGHPLTDKQRKFFGAIAGGAEPYEAQTGTKLNNVGCPPGWVNIKGRCFDPKSEDYKELYNLGIGYFAGKNNPYGLDEDVFVSSRSELPEVVLKPISSRTFLDNAAYYDNNQKEDDYVPRYPAGDAIHYAFDQLGKKYGFPKVRSQSEYQEENPLSFYSLGKAHYNDGTIYANDIDKNACITFQKNFHQNIILLRVSEKENLHVRENKKKKKNIRKIMFVPSRKSRYNLHFEY